MASELIHLASAFTEIREATESRKDRCDNAFANEFGNASGTIQQQISVGKFIAEGSKCWGNSQKESGKRQCNCKIVSDPHFRSFVLPSSLLPSFIYHCILQAVVDEKKKKRDEKLKQIQLQREAVEQEKAEKLRKIFLVSSFNGSIRCPNIL